MTTDPKVVPEGDVVFGQSTARPDAVAESSAEQPQRPNSPGIATIAHYLQTVCRFVSDKSGDAFDLRGLDQCRDSIRFNNTLALVALPLPKSKYIEILGRDYPDHAYILENTDLENLPDKLPITQDLPEKFCRTFNPVLQWDVPKAARDALLTTEQCFAIPNLLYLSLFVNDGRVLDEYLTHSGYTAPPEPLWARYRPNTMTVNTTGDIPTLELDVTKVRAFVEATGTKTLAQMTQDIENLRKELKDQDDLRQRIILARRLMQYHPELMI